MENCDFVEQSVVSSAMTVKFGCRHLLTDFIDNKRGTGIDNGILRSPTNVSRICRYCRSGLPGFGDQNSEH